MGWDAVGWKQLPAEENDLRSIDAQSAITGPGVNIWEGFRWKGKAAYGS